MKHRIVMNATLAPRVNKQTPPSASPRAERNAAPALDPAPVSRQSRSSIPAQIPPAAKPKPQTAAQQRHSLPQTSQILEPPASQRSISHPVPKPHTYDNFYRFPERETLVLAPQPEAFASPQSEPVPAPRAFHALAAVRAQQKRILSQLPPQRSYF